MLLSMRWLLRIAVVLVLTLAVVAAAAYGWLRQSLPRTEGEIRLAGLERPVDVLRDAWGIPHIFAQSPNDAVFALGYVHAQDRLWQMEMNRRIGAGRLAEVLGAGALETDRFLRTLGVRRSAEASLAVLSAETRSALAAYAAGVNAFLASDPVLPPEYWLTGAKPEPWNVVDSIAWTKMMAWDLGGNWRNEILRMQLAKTLTVAQIHEFLPPYPGDAAQPLPELRELYGAMGTDAVRLAAGAQAIAEQVDTWTAGAAGSNNWVVSGARSASGKPLLANDPHLGLSAPPIWYFAHLHAPGLDVIGATLPGVPAVVLGRNARIAWGFTNTGPDVQDLFIEKLDGAGRYLTPEGPQAFKRIEETIRVKGGTEERLSIRVSRHGPVISDVSRVAADAVPRGHVLAFSWTALAEDDRTLESAAQLARAGNWEEFLAAARHFHAPQQNMVYADIEGNIGFVAAGKVPVRKPENDLKGLAPAPGWLARYDWNGFLPFDALPRQYNPASGAIVTANHKITAPGYAHHLTSEWEPPYRARRIEALLDALPKHTVPSFARIQADAVSLATRELLPRLLATRPRSEPARKALLLLGAWDGTMAAERAEPLILAAWWRELARAIYADDLGEAFRPNWRARAVFLGNVLTDRDGQSRWCDDKRTRGIETCDEQLALTLEAALADLRKRYGEDMGLWKWGSAHVARHEHRPLGRQALLARWFDINVPSAGDPYTVNVGRNNFFDEAQPFANRHAASLRAIYDLADPEKSLFIHSGGQSGNSLSPHYAAFSAAWSKGEYIPMRTARAAIEAAGAQRLALVPR